MNSILAQGELGLLWGLKGSGVTLKAGYTNVCLSVWLRVTLRLQKALCWVRWCRTRPSRLTPCCVMASLGWLVPHAELGEASVHPQGRRAPPALGAAGVVCFVSCKHGFINCPRVHSCAQGGLVVSLPRCTSVVLPFLLLLLPISSSLEVSCSV